MIINTDDIKEAGVFIMIYKDKGQIFTKQGWKGDALTILGIIRQFKKLLEKMEQGALVEIEQAKLCQTDERSSEEKND